jgi:hypothetical protein
LDNDRGRFILFSDVDYVVGRGEAGGRLPEAHRRGRRGMIGRFDLVFPTTLPTEEALDVCASAILFTWRAAVFEDAETADVYRAVYVIPFAHVRELLVYRDNDAYEGWERLGADPSNAGR